MSRFLIIVLMMAAVLIFGLIIGLILGEEVAARNATDGTCMRTEDGEAYLRISEAGQRKLLDPETKLLHIRVVDVAGIPTRK